MFDIAFLNNSDTSTNNTDNINADNMDESIVNDDNRQHNVCIFCNQRCRKRKGRRQNLNQLVSVAKKNLISDLLKLQGEQEKANIIHSTAKQTFYHQRCFSELFDKRLMESLKNASKTKDERDHT